MSIDEKNQANPTPGFGQMSNNEAHGAMRVLTAFIKELSERRLLILNCKEPVTKEGLHKLSLAEGFRGAGLLATGMLNNLGKASMGAIITEPEAESALSALREKTPSTDQGVEELVEPSEGPPIAEDEDVNPQAAEREYEEAPTEESNDDG